MTVVPTDPLHGHTPADAAEAYASLGWRIVPIIPGRKHPGVEAWQRAATDDLATIRSWFGGLYRGHGVGVACGQGSDIWVLDVDDLDAIARLEEAIGCELPLTVTSRSGSGRGVHLFYQWDRDRPITNGHSRNLPDGIDVRGEGGQVVIPPTVHPNGDPYTWLRPPQDWSVADAPDALYELMFRPVEQPTRPAPAPGPAHLDDGDSIAAWTRTAYSYPALLEQDGWTLSHTSGDDSYWVRPGKNPRDGHSAVLHGTDGPLVVFSTEAPRGLIDPSRATADGSGYAHSLFGYIAATRHGGDRSEAARGLRKERQRSEGAAAALTPLAVDLSEAEDTPDVDPDAPPLAAWQIDWSEFWQRDPGASDWLCEPFLARGRAHALFAGAKSGKSLLTLEVAAALATGSPVLAKGRTEPVDVLYVDYEMTEDDLHERLDDFGYGPEVDMSRLHYVLLPSIDGLDTKTGAQTVINSAKAWGCQLVVIDTTARAVEGEENDADTYRDLSRHLGIGLKSAGIAYVRLDHAGKDKAKGQRGSSAKNDDVDVVWRLERREGGAITLKATHRRMGWVPEDVELVLGEGRDGMVHRITSGGVSYPTGTGDVVKVMDELGLPLDISKRKAGAAIRAAGRSVDNTLVGPALKWRKAGAMRAVDNVLSQVHKRAENSSAHPLGPDVQPTSSPSDVSPGQPASSPLQPTPPTNFSPPRHPVGGAGAEVPLPEPENDPIEHRRPVPFVGPECPF